LLVGARTVVEKYDGKLPDNAKDMEANIPGIGRYSAGAISSIAYGERAPVVSRSVWVPSEDIVLTVSGARWQCPSSAE